VRDGRVRVVQRGVVRLRLRDDSRGGRHSGGGGRVAEQLRLRLPACRLGSFLLGPLLRLLPGTHLLRRLAGGLGGGLSLRFPTFAVLTLELILSLRLGGGLLALLEFAGRFRGLRRSVLRRLPL